MTEHEIEIEHLDNKITGLEDERDALKDRVKALEEESSNQEATIEELEDEVADLEQIPHCTSYVAVLERLADTRNWIDGRYAPITKELYDDVPSLCSAILRENT